MGTASTEAMYVFRKPALADITARYWGGANATAWPRGRCFLTEGFAPIGTAPVVVRGSTIMLMQASQSAKSQTKAAANIQEGV